ncbi:hypothetical protein J6590_005708, partial [Homalodisca vitripennis]
KTLRSFISAYNQQAQALILLRTDVAKESAVLVALMLRKVDVDMGKHFEQSSPSAHDTHD